MMREGDHVEHVLNGDHYEVAEVTSWGEAKLVGVDNDDVCWVHEEDDEHGPLQVE